MTNQTNALLLAAIGFGAYYFLTRKPSVTATRLPEALTPYPQAGQGTGSNADAQRLLNKIFPDAHLIIDGIVGPKTRKQVLRFQEMWGLPTDGLIGPETLYYIKSAAGEVGYTDTPFNPGLPIWEY